MPREYVLQVRDPVGDAGAYWITWQTAPGDPSGRAVLEALARSLRADTLILLRDMPVAAKNPPRR